MAPGRLLPSLVVVATLICGGVSVGATPTTPTTLAGGPAEDEVLLLATALNRDYAGKSVLPDLGALLRLDALPEVHRPAAEQFRALWDEHLTAVKGYDVIRDIPFTLIIPNRIDRVALESLDEPRAREFLLEHVIPGALVELKDGHVYANANQHPVGVNLTCINMLLGYVLRYAQDTQEVRVVGHRHNVTDTLAVVFIDGNLTENKAAVNTNKLNKRNIQENNRYNEPQRLEMKNATKELAAIKENRIGQHLMNFLASMKSGTKVFQHFLSSSNLSQLLDDSSYMVLIPSDTAFQRWHPIDWGFYPFSVQEFTESVLRNHFVRVRQPPRMADLRSGAGEQKFKTLGGEMVVLKSKPIPNVNNVSIMYDYTLSNGVEVFVISEVLFVSEAVVSRLHQMHKDKETPPLLAFPWFGAQFLSHSFLALERDNRFTQITRFLNTAEIAQFISGSNYTFFVPTDEAFERYSFDILPDNVLASEKGVKLLLNHFIKGRLYDRDLKDGEVLDTIGGMPVKIHRTFDQNVTVNSARIVESEVFVYNLGTMFYVDDVLYPELLKDEVTAITEIKTPDKNIPDEGSDVYTTDVGQQDQTSSTTPTPAATSTTHRTFFTTSADVEFVPLEITEQNGSDDDFLLQDDEIITPKALPVKYYYSPKK
uniref:Putative conserved secreted protein n=1 Tax=Culex tarsalis TaxID=7177 RepID=A0A1Q3FNA5_CULTA